MLYLKHADACMLYFKLAFEKINLELLEFWRRQFCNISDDSARRSHASTFRRASIKMASYFEAEQRIKKNITYQTKKLYLYILVRLTLLSTSSVYFSGLDKQKYIYLFAESKEAMSNDLAPRSSQSQLGPANPATSVQGQVADVQAFIN
jgi:hypothetical protein